MVLGYDLTTSHFTGINDDLISSKKLVLPDVVLVRKIYSKDDFDDDIEDEDETNNQTTTNKKRMFTLQSMEVDGIGVEDDNEMIVGEALMVDEDEMGGDGENKSTSQRQKKRKKKTKRKEFQMSRKQMEVWSFQIYLMIIKK